jgi:hypothetical protein
MSYILLIEDHLDGREMVTEYLTFRGMEVLAVGYLRGPMYFCGQCEYSWTVEPARSSTRSRSKSERHSRTPKKAFVPVLARCGNDVGVGVFPRKDE